MDRQEKVIKGLECCIVRRKGDNRHCPECPYRDPTIDCTNQLHIDVQEVIETLSSALDAVTGDDCKECEIIPGQEGEADE